MAWCPTISKIFGVFQIAENLLHANLKGYADMEGNE
jgi:hypothetical protein